MPERRPTGCKILGAKSPDKEFKLIWANSGSGVGFGFGLGVGFGSGSGVGFRSGPSDTSVASFGSGCSILGPNGSAVGVGKRAAPLLTRTK